MKTLEEFKGYYENIIKPELEPLESDRIKVRNKTLLAIVFMIIVAAIGAYLYISMYQTARSNGYSYNSNRSDEGLGFFVSLYIALCSFILYKIRKSYTSDFKDKIIHKIINYIEPGLNYRKEDSINQNYFEDTDLFSEPNIYSGDDYVSGTIADKELLDSVGEERGTPIEFSEIEAKRESGSGKNRRVSLIFKGLFFMAEYNKNFNAYTRIIPDNKKAWLFSGKDRVKLEDPEFEKYFEVYGDDQIESRYIVTPSLMERLIRFKKSSNRPVYLAFKDSKIYICIEYNRNLFEPNLFKTLYDFAPMQQYFEDLNLAIGIVEELNLNTRVWSKN